MDRVLVGREGPVTTVTLNRPDAMNALTPGMHRLLEEAFNGFAEDDSQRVCVVTGAGERAFCAGSDLKLAAVEGLPDIYPPHGYAGLAERFDCPKPFIAAVNGLALGGGFEIALACDIVIAADNARFGLPEPLVGAIALGGGLHRLVRQIGLKTAMGLILSSRQIGADEALRLGLINEVVPSPGLAGAVRGWCHDILKGSPMAIRASKATVMRGLDEASLAQAMERQASWPEFAAWRNGSDLIEGMAAFRAKRDPEWNQPSPPDGTGRASGLAPPRPGDIS